MSIKTLFVSTFLLLVVAANTFPQTVTVSQGFVDDATRSFGEVRALRTLTDAQKSELEAKETLISALKAQTEALKSQVEAEKILNSALTKQNERLAAKTCAKTSFLFGAITIKRCT